jgi:hypothetical protein
MLPLRNLLPTYQLAFLFDSTVNGYQQSRTKKYPLSPLANASTKTQKQWTLPLKPRY